MDRAKNKPGTKRGLNPQGGRKEAKPRSSLPFVFTGNPIRQATAGVWIIVFLVTIEPGTYPPLSCVAVCGRRSSELLESSAKTSRAWWHLSTIQQRVGSASVWDAYLVPSPPNLLFISAKLPASRSLTHQEEKHEAHACQPCSAEKYKAARVAPRTVGLKSFLKQFLGDSAREQKKKKTHKNPQKPTKPTAPRLSDWLPAPLCGCAVGSGDKEGFPLLQSRI